MIAEPRDTEHRPSDLSRRSFIKVVGGVGASLMLGSFASACSAASASATNKAAFIPSAFVKLDPDGCVTITISRAEMGQGVRTSLAMLVAEEMDADWSKVCVVQAPADQSKYGNQGTGGSQSIASMNHKMRELGATTRMMLISAAAKRWNVDPATCKTDNGKVLHPDGKQSIVYQDLTAEAASETPPTSVTLKPRSEFKLVTKGAKRIDCPDIVTGKAKYSLDATVPGMVYAVVARPETFEGSVKTFDDSAARKVPGVVDVQKFNNGVAVFATNTWAAISGRNALKVEWDAGAHPDLDSDFVWKQLKGAVIEHPAMPDGAKVVEASYELPFLAHATMEPMNALADYKDGSCRVWAGSQVPDSAQQTVASALGIPEEKVEMNNMLLGGGFGRKLNPDYIKEAALLSKLANKPVKLLWTREDDMKHDNYRPAMYSSLKGAIGSDGKPSAWSHQAIQPGGGRRRSGDFGHADLVYDIPGAVQRSAGAQVFVPTGAWRSVEFSLMNPVTEMFIDELAHAAKADPYEFRMSLIKDERMKNVLQAAAKFGDWGKPLPAGWGRGIACFNGSFWVTRVAHVVELSVSGDKIKVHRVVAVVDCGLPVNPYGIEQVVTSGCSDGLATALRAEITIEKGGAAQSSWNDYKWMTMDAMPKVEVHILETDNQPSGMGEPPYPSVPPAVANAVFAATGRRVRKLPIKISELV